MQWLDNMVLRTKLILLTAVMMAALVMLGVMGYKVTNGWQADVSELGEARVPSLIGCGTVRNGVQMVAIQTNRARGLRDHPAMREKMQDVAAEMQKGFDRIDKGMKAYEAAQSTPEAHEMWNSFLPDYEQWRKQNEAFKTNVVDRLAATDDPKQIEELFGSMTAHIEAVSALRKSMQDKLQKVYDITKKNVVETTARAKEQSASYRQLFMTVVVGTLVTALLLSMLIIRSITRSITQSVTAIRDGALQITSASDQVASSSTSLAQGASEQASSVEEVSATLEQSTAINAQNTDNARQADILAKNANDSARTGYEKGERLTASMHAITESAARISGIIKAIDQIAFQTNLLALNAAVEAARAGEHGLGFAVVADEVRNLAQRAAAAAKETAAIIEVVVVQIKEGNEIAVDTHHAFADILDKSKKVSDLIGEISIASKEQNEGMAQISQAMGQVDQVTQQVAANSEEAAAAAEELNAQAMAMMETVRVLAALVGMPTQTASASTLHPVVRKSGAHPPVHVAKPDVTAPRSSGKGVKPDEIFPLHEDDLKEF